MLMTENTTTNNAQELSSEEKKRAGWKRYRDAHKEEKKARDKAWREANKEKRKSQAVEWRENNKERVKSYRKKRRQPGSLCAIKERIRAAVSRSFWRISRGKVASTLTLLGCTYEQAKAHFESLFQEGMNWTNYGYMGWHIDHIRPVSSFGEDDLHLMNHISNLQPLWWYDNLSKSNDWK